MSFHTPARRLLRPGSNSLATKFSPGLITGNGATTGTICAQVRSHQRAVRWTTPRQTRSLWGFGKKSNAGSQSNKKGSNAEDEEMVTKLSQNPQLRQLMQRSMGTVEGGMFEGEIQEAARVKAAQNAEGAAGGPQNAQDVGAEEPEDTIDPKLSVLHLDPNPRSRVFWERRQVINMVRRRGLGNDDRDGLTKKQRIQMTEREFTFRSYFWSTSTKKLMFLARQIAHKPLDDAMVQMRFSKKKYAQHILRHLQHTKNRAVAEYGMGLGKARGEAPLAKPIVITTNQGDKIAVDDPSRMYISQAWVNRGKVYPKRVYRHGRGRRNWLRTRTSTLTVMLKEEKTRIREHREREIKKIRAKPWLQLPNKPITGQNQYYSW